MSSARPWGEAPAPQKGPGLVTALIVLVCLAILIGLGVWQLQRLKWKEGVLAHVAALQTAAARPLAIVLAQGGDLYCVRVSFDSPDLERRLTLRLFSVRDGVAGYRLIAACPATGGGYASILGHPGFPPLE